MMPLEIAKTTTTKKFIKILLPKFDNRGFTSSMLLALSFVSNFLIGGLSGIFMAATPVDIFIHDTYYIVAHFHYVVAGIVFALFAAVYYWFPKMFGRQMNEGVAKIHFVLT